MKTINKLIIITVLILSVYSCQSNKRDSTQKGQEQKQEISVDKEVYSSVEDTIENKNRELNINEIKKSFVISCGSGCAIRYTAEHTITKNISINVKFKIEMYTDETLVDTYFENYIFTYNQKDEIQKIQLEGDNENILETLMPDAQSSFRNFANTLIHNELVLENKTTHSQILTALPFNLTEWIEWQTAIDKAEMENDGRYKEMILSDNKNLQQLIASTDKNAHYFILESDKTDCTMYIVIYSQEDKVGLFFNLVNIRDNKKIDTLPLGALLDGDRKSFSISQDLEIVLFDEKMVYSEEENRDIVATKEKTGTYRIQQDGKIMEIE
jgi:hypothetical protein